MDFFMKAGIALWGWAVMLGLFNPFFENRRMREATIGLAALGTVFLVCS